MEAKKRSLIELIIVATLFLTVREIFKNLEIKYSSQIALAVSLLVITFILNKNAITWRDLGFRRPDHLGKAILLTVLCIVTIGVTFNFIVAPLFPEGANEINGGGTISFYEMLFQVIVIAVGAAAIGEELLFRGFLLNWLNKITGKNTIGTTMAVIFQALIFALLHRGMQGIVSAGIIGVILAIFYLLSNRNLIVVMAAHAVPDLLSVISSYQNQ